MKKRNLRALEAFDAVARLGSVNAAAEELGITQSAISHQLRHLSCDLGEQLLRRVGRRVELTPAGQRLAGRLKSAFEHIDRSVAETVGADHTTVRLAVCSCFAPGWLIRRLGSLYAAHPDFKLRLCMYAADPKLTDEVADAFVTTYPTVPGFDALHLKSEFLVAVRARIGGDESVRLPLITTDGPPGVVGQDWIEYSRATDLDLGAIHTGTWLQATHYVIAMEMARRRLGVALVPDFLAEDLLQEGLLELAHEEPFPTREDYYLCYKTARRDEPALRLLAAWFRSQIANGTSMNGNHMSPTHMLPK